MFKINLTQPINPYFILEYIHDIIEESQFKVANISYLKITSKRSSLSNTRHYFGTILLKNIRLKKARPYRGSEIEDYRVNRKVVNRTYLDLEGWEDFNDLINDALDKFRLEAIVESAKFRIRSNNKRRDRYQHDKDRYGDIDHDYFSGY